MSNTRVKRHPERLGLSNAIGFVKYIQGMCNDQVPHWKVKAELIELTEMLYEIRERFLEAATSESERLAAARR